jgi:O-antigen/teichoic acid export membrane protein
MQAYSPRNIALYTSFNIFGRIVPMLAALIGIPVIIGRLGDELFGILAIVWVFVGYTTIVDMGLPRGLIKVLSDNSEEPPRRQIHIISTATVMMLGFGALGGLLIALLSEPLVTSWLKIEPHHHEQAKRSLVIIGLAYPLLVCLGGMRAVLEFQRAFKTLNLYNIVFGSLNYLLPALVVLFYPTLMNVVLVTVLVRLLHTIQLYRVVRRHYQGYHFPTRIMREYVSPLFAFSKWIVGGLVLSTILTVIDRFLIGGLLSMTDVTYYSTPLEILVKLDLIPFALVAVLFPAFALATAQKTGQVAQMYNLALKLMAVLFALICFFLVFSAETLLTLWIGSEFAANAAPAFRLLTVSIYLVSLCYIAQTLVQGVGKPFLSVVSYLILMVLGLPLTYLLIAGAGIEGAALARGIRALLEFIIISLIIRKVIGLQLSVVTMLIIFAGLALIISAMYVPATLISLALSMLVAPVLVLLFWKYGLSASERSSILGILPEDVRQKFEKRP